METKQLIAGNPKEEFYPVINPDSSGGGSIEACIVEIASTGNSLTAGTYDKVKAAFESNQPIYIKFYNGLVNRAIQVNDNGNYINLVISSISKISDYRINNNDTWSNPNSITYLKPTDVLTKTNSTAFTPTADYHPAPKKYVDDALANAGSAPIYVQDNVFQTNAGNISQDTATKILEAVNGNKPLYIGDTHGLFAPVTYNKISDTEIWLSYIMIWVGSTSDRAICSVRINPQTLATTHEVYNLDKSKQVNIIDLTEIYVILKDAGIGNNVDVTEQVNNIFGSVTDMFTIVQEQNTILKCNNNPVNVFVNETVSIMFYITVIEDSAVKNLIFNIANDGTAIMMNT